MRVSRFFTKQIQRWWPDEPLIVLPTLQARSNVPQSPKSAHTAKSVLDWLMAWQKPLRSGLSAQLAGHPSPRPPRRKKHITHPKIVFLTTALALTASMGQRFYNQPQLQVETNAPQTLVAPDTATVVDNDSTEAKRTAARSGALRVLMLDAEANSKMHQTLTSLLQQGTDLRQQARSVPFVEPSTLSTRTQHYIRQAEDTEWTQIWLLVSSLQANTLPSPASTYTLPDSLQPLVSQLSADQRQVVNELLSYRQRASTQEFKALKTLLNDVRSRYQQAVSDLANLSQKSSNPYDTSVLDLTDADWQTTQEGIRQVADQMIHQGIMPGLPTNLLQEAVKIHLEGNVPPIARAMATQLLLAVLEPNLVEDPERTRLQAEKAAQAVEPVVVTINAGDVIVYAGDKITQSDFVLLDHFGLSRRRFNWLGFVGFGLLTGGALGLFLFVEHHTHHSLRRRDYFLISLLVLGTSGTLLFGLDAVALPAVGLLTGSFYGSVVGATVISLLAVVLPIGTSVGGIPLVSNAVGALVGSVIASRLRSREELALLGGIVGLTQGGVHLILTLILSPVSAAAWYGILTTSALQGVYGVISSIVAIGLSPYLEHMFDLVTPIRLAELANPNRPLLKRLASEAPGTFQHTLFVASLAEAAARDLGCNVELVRAGTLYHDIGKMHDPLGFIENQMGGPNKHDMINQPWTSAEIIKKHVTEGLAMARRHRLPKALQAFIPEHQGTMQISYFYHQAQQQAAEDPTIQVDEADFRYDGPIPQSPETGIVMLADSCEAALRSLKEATPDEALVMVNKILRARWKDGQMADSGLTREDMARIAEVFVQVWLQYNHKRIAYPKAALALQPLAERT